ncbi:metal ABC transporter solute-binding protein, Zn/Mn family [Gracilibacillus xinjiangensis]|uniref:Metal ABC transporter solute-binding protein, Zn/Mn family n=1 Tax=Gracilibacillus xinjiangensis TaxID=1193282 RepID=A0ABV8WR81_9BACI
MQKWILLSLLSVFLLTACSDSDAVSNTNGDTSNETDSPVLVVTTIAQIADVVENVGGDHVEVESLMGPGIDPHLYNAVQGDIEKLDNAEIIFYNGLHLEGQMYQVFEQMEKEKPAIAVAESIEESKLLSDPENPNIFDPHVWFDVTLWQDVVTTVRDELIELDSENKKSYEKNAEVYLNELQATEEYILDSIEQIPEESRVLVTAHDAFHYFGEKYGFEVVGLQGLSTESDYSTSDINNIVQLLMDRNIKGVFVESSISDRSIQAVIEGAKEKGQMVEIGGELFSDAMGEEGTEEGTYIGMLRHNINTIVETLK